MKACKIYLVASAVVLGAISTYFFCCTKTEQSNTQRLPDLPLFREGTHVPVAHPSKLPKAQSERLEKQNEGERLEQFFGTDLKAYISTRASIAEFLI
jgi:hypothetical protein